MDIAQCFDLSKRYFTNGELGIEVEVEGSSLPREVGDYWRCERDGSLRGESMEYVLKSPMKKCEAMLAVDYLAAKYVRCGSVVDDSVRCGVHVHVNVQKLTITQLYNFFTLYAMFEWILLSYCGAGRTGNLFCLPLNKSPLLVKALRDVATNKKFRDLHSDEYRYCAMNVKALGTYGSLEFRALRGGPDLSRVKLWASFLLHLKEVACTFKDPTEIVEEASIDGYFAFFNRVVHSAASNEFKGMFSGVMNKHKKLLNGGRSALPIAFAGNWRTMEKEVDPYEDFC